MRWRTGASALTPKHLAAVFAASFVASLLLLRPAATLYHPTTSAKYSPPDAPTDNDQIHSSIIVPAYHERDNLAPLVKSVFAAVRDPAGTEIIIVDDNSRDGTVEEIQRLKRDEGHNVELLVRTDEKGLSSAVLRGFERARGQKMIVMDADLQVCLEKRDGCFPNGPRLTALFTRSTRPKPFNLFLTPCRRRRLSHSGPDTERVSRCQRIGRCTAESFLGARGCSRGR